MLVAFFPTEDGGLTHSKKLHFSRVKQNMHKQNGAADRKYENSAPGT